MEGNEDQVLAAAILATDGFSPFSVEEEGLFPTTQINAKILTAEKGALIALAQSKGVGGITGLLKLLARAKEVTIIL